jgi:solute carrier family 25 phosphate transporter 23/24/25/41
VSPYYMKVGLDMGTRRLPIPDRRKDGSPWGHLFAGGLAGIASKTVSSPLNVVAVRSIAGPAGAGAGATSMHELWKMMVQIFQKEGPRGLFKGNMANSFSSAPGKAIDFFAYATYKGMLTGNGDREPTNVERLMAGSLAGMTSDSILYPLEVVSTRVTLEKGKYGNFVQAMVQIAKKEGIRGLYAGWGAAMIGVIPYAGISFGCYDILSTQYRKTMNVESAGPLPTLCIGFASGWLASTLSFPMYSATVRLQSGLVPLLADGSKANLVSIMLGTLRTDGWRALFNGWFPATVKIIPQAGTSFVIYEMVKRKLDKANFYDADEDDDLDDN